MNKFVFLLCFGLFSLSLQAQEVAGTTGLLNIPTADMMPDGTFRVGGNYLPQNFTPDVFDYNTGNYYLNLTFLPFLEVSYRCTLLKTMSTGKYTQQDRSFGLRLRLLKEKKYLPALVVGGNDIYSDKNDGGKQYFNSTYVVATKSANWNENLFSLTLGTGVSEFSKEGIDGLYAGLAFSPGFCRPLKIMTDYDSNFFNLGGSVLLFNHLHAYAFVNDFQHFVGGISYRIYLKTEGRRLKKDSISNIQ